MREGRCQRRCGMAVLVAGLMCGMASADVFGADDAATSGPLSISRGGAVTNLRLGDETPFRSTASQVRDAREITVANDPTRVVTWTEIDASGDATPYYAVSFDGRTVAAVKPTSYELKMRAGDFDPLSAAAPVAAGLDDRADHDLYIVQFVTQPLEAYHGQIRDLGGKVHQFLPQHAHLIEIPSGKVQAVRDLPYVRWVGPYATVYKLEEMWREDPTQAADKYPLERYSIELVDPTAENKAAFAARLKQLGAKVDNPDAGKLLVEATLTPDQLIEVAGWDTVLFVDRWSPLETDMDIVREIGGANYVETVAGYTGQGVRAEFFDAGFNVNHPDLQAVPLLQHGGTVGVSDHGTAVAGVIVGSGANAPTARGLMPSAQGIVADYNNVGLSGTNRYTHTAELKGAPYNAVFQTSSVGSATTTSYTTVSAEHDAMLFDLDVLHCQSQSNTGTRSSRPQAWAKNVLSGGAFNHYNTLTESDDCWCGTASIGPASDGRIKPDLSFFYDDTYTTYSTGSGYGQFGGTSGATPTICGYTGLFFQMWADGIFGNEISPGGTVFSSRPHMTTAKAAMINTANQYPFTGATSDMTRVHQGWGRPSVQNLYDLRDNMSFIDETELISNLETLEFTVFVEAGEPALRLTMVYADPAGSPSASVQRINDLTLKVTSPTGTVYWGNYGLSTGNWSVADGQADTLNTVENVFVQTPAAGVWGVEIIASEINQDGHVETPELDADFALVVSGGYLATCTSEGRLILDRPKYACGGFANLRVIDCDLNTDDTVVDTATVWVVSDSDTNGEMVVLTETAAETSDFRGQVIFGAAPDEGVVQVAPGDYIGVTYIDADNGAGGTNVEVVKIVPVDCDLPVISNVTAINIEPRSATITFETDEPAEATIRYGDSCDNLTEEVRKPGVELVHSVDLPALMDGKTYFFAVEAEDEAGNIGVHDLGGICNSFITPDVPDYFTEQFSNFDLENQMLTFVPDGSFGYYAGCVEPIIELPTDPTGGTTITITSDDGFGTYAPTNGQVSLFGQSYGTVYISGNGYLTFTQSDDEYDETLTNHFSLPRVAALFDDLSPQNGGPISVKDLSDRVVITWQDIPEYNTSNSNTFQIEMFYDGTIRIAYLGIGVSDGLAGLSAGDGVPSDYYPSDLSGIGSCGPRPPSALPQAISTPLNTDVEITLTGRDDGLPDPPAALTFTVLTLPSQPLRDMNTGAIITQADLPHTLVGDPIVRFEPRSFFQGDDGFAFRAEDGGVAPEGGSSDPAVVQIRVGGVEAVYSFDLSTDPGWTTEGNWAWGQPTGYSGSRGADPTAGHTGDNVYGYNLEGYYENNMPVYALTTSAMDLTGVVDAELRFWRWLGVESSSYDHASIEISTDGENWDYVWVHISGSTAASSWTEVSYDISNYADDQPQVYLRWTMGTSDNSVTYAGWNIDDIEIRGLRGTPGDWDGDGDVDLEDFAHFPPCMTEPGESYGIGCGPFDADRDGDVDLTDFAVFQMARTQ